MIYVNKKHLNDEHAAGTKVFVYPSKESSAQLSAFVKNNLNVKADILVRPDQYHCTVIYSKSACPGAENMDINLPMVGGVQDYEIFESAHYGKCLVAVLHCQAIRDLNKEIRDTFGAVSDFPTFIPHITLAWGYQGVLPSLLPKFALTFDAYKVAGLDPNWTPNDLKK
jgi:hypothetical protein